MATPPQATIERAILKAIAEYHVRPGRTFSLLGVQIQVHQQGFHADDIDAALQAMQAKGWIKAASFTHFTITEAGFAAL